MEYLKQFKSVFKDSKLLKENSLPLSIGQYDIWVEQQLYPNNISNHSHFVAKIDKQLNFTAFEKAIRQLAERHEIIRTIFPLVGGIPVRHFLSTNEIYLRVEECLDFSEKEIKLKINKNFEIPFDLLAEPPYRFFLYRQSDSQYYFQMIEHHVAVTMDAYVNLPIELAKLYVSELNQKTSDLTIPISTFSNFVQKQYEEFASDRFQQDKNYWTSYLSGNLPSPILPTQLQSFDFTDFISKVYHCNLEDGLINRLKEIAFSLNASIFSILTSAFQTLLHRYTNQEEILIGIPNDTRRGIHKEVLGYTANTLPLRSKFTPNQEFVAFTKKTNSDIRNMIKHRLYPLTAIMDDLRSERGNTFSELFKIVIISQKTEEFKEIAAFGVGKEGVVINIDGFEYESVGIGLMSTGRFDLALAISETSQGYVASFHYNSSLFKDEAIEALACNFLKILKSIVSNPHQKIEELSIVSDEEKDLQLNIWNSTSINFAKPGSFIDWFEKIATTTPKAIAINFEGKKIDYEELNSLANQLAQHLKKLGATKETLIGIGVYRSFDLIISLLAVMKTGSAYLPMDPAHPKERLQFILEDSQAEILITQQSIQEVFHDYNGKLVLLDKEWDKISKENKTDFKKNIGPDQLAYVIYTSGSTGKPKGVEILQKSLDNLLLALQQQLQFTFQDRWLALTTISFDISNLEILLPLSQGATVVLANQDTVKDPFLLSQMIENDQITFAQATPSTWQMLIDFGWRGNARLSILCGGEALSQTLAEKLLKSSYRLWNMYGPTETTIWSSLSKVENENKRITIGRPIANTSFYILDENQQLLPIGIPGELYIGGIGLARSYRNRPQLTEERFIRSPFISTGKLYRTGDLVRYLPGGEIEYLGRLDHQVKIHGYRIELGEIEENLKKYAEIQEAVVVAREDKLGNKRLVAYYNGNADESEIKRTLSIHLPEYMLPSAYVKLKDFPLTPNGKIDRNSLPEPEYLFKKTNYIAPQNSIEAEIVQIFEALLGIKKISVDSHFFSIGGHSLLAAQAVSKINRNFHINLPLKTLFEKPTVSLIAKEVELSLKNVDKLCLLEQTKIRKVSKKSTFNLSYSQQRFWFLEQQTRDSPLYNIPFILEFTGDLNVSYLQGALDTIVQRHEILRTIFREGVNAPKQLILSEVATTLRYEDLSTYQYPEEAINHLIEAEAKKPFDLTVSPLFRFLLIRKQENQHILFLNFHHIIFDGYSTCIFVHELKALYEANSLMQSKPLKDLEIQYKDFVHWQLNTGKELEKPFLTWIEKLKGAPQILNLPIDKSRPNIQTYNGALLEFLIIEKDDFEDLKQLVQKHESTLFMVLLSLFHIFLYRYTGQSDMIIGIPVSARTYSSLDSLVGCFINTLPLRITSKNESTFLELLKWVKDESLEALTHQDIPFERIIEKLKIERSLSHSPVFQVMFNMFPEIEINQIDNLQVTLKNVDRGMAHFDLSLSLQETSNGLLGSFEYNTDLFHKETIERMFKHFQKLVRGILKNPDQTLCKIPMLLDSEIQQQVIEWNRQPIAYFDHENILQLIEKWAEKSPDAPAIIYNGEIYSYYQINIQANKIAHTLLEHGLKSEDKVVICLERSPEFISAVLGILKAGGAYVPIDPTQPAERINGILKDLDFPRILTYNPLKKKFSGYPCICLDEMTTTCLENPRISIAKEQLAYIIYTSGSTGKPKGVEIEHKSINDRVLWKNAAYPLTPNDALLHTYAFIFDGAIINYFWPLCSGASLVIATKEEQLEPGALIQLIQKYNVTTMDLLPSLLQSLLEEDEIGSCCSLKNVFSGGEALSGTIMQSFYEKFPDVKLHNTYGPTEATVEASVWECDPNYVGSIAPIGKPIAGAKLYILDHNQNIVPIGVPGELHIGGRGLARGYLNDASLTAEKFINNPLITDSEERLYRTGDLVKYCPDGNIEFLGRSDAQVKIRGYRIDLREIESTLLHMDPVERVIVKMKGDHLHKYLVAYVILNARMDEKIFVKLMKHYLAERLPAYMIPQQIMILDSFPTLPNEKINYAALPDPLYQEKELAFSAGNECKNALERQILSLWKEVLKVENISTIDNFFEIGGNSLLAMRLVSRIKSKMNISIPLVQLFQFPTVETLCQSLNLSSKKKPWSPIVLMQSKGQKEPFFCVHPVGGSILCYNALAKHWTADRPFYALQARGLEEDQIPHASIELMAQEYIREILKIQSVGPYYIGGWSYGGLVATEIARQLLSQGELVALLVLIDTSANIEKIQDIDIENESLLLSELTNHFIAEPPLAKKSRLSFKERFVRFIENGGKRPLKKGQKSEADRLIALAKANYRALQNFSIPTLDIDVALVRTKINPERMEDLGWTKYATHLKIFDGPGDHWAITQNDQARHYAKILQEALSTVNLSSKANIKVA